MSEFISMNGFGAYIWSSFAITALFMVGEVLLVKAQNRHQLQALRRKLRQQGDL